MSTTVEASETVAPQQRAAGLLPMLLGLLVVSAVSATAIGLQIGGGAYEPPATGIVDAGPLVGWLQPLARTIALLAGVATLGWLGYAAFLGPQKRGGFLGGSGLADIRRAGVAAALWVITSLLAAVLSLSAVLGIALSEAIRPAIFRQYAWDVPIVRSYLIAAGLAAVIWVACRWAQSLAAAAGWFVVAAVGLALSPLAGHAAGYGDHALALTSGLVHVLAMAVWCGALLALAWHGWRNDPGVPEAAKRYSPVALTAVALLVFTGVGSAYTRMDTISDLWNSGYGRLLTIKVLVFVFALVAALFVRRRLFADWPTDQSHRPRIAGLVTVELLLMSIAAGLAVALAVTPYPRSENSALTLVEQLLGRSIPEAPTFTNVVFGWQFEPLFFVGGIIAMAVYVAGVVRLRTRGDSWPLGRTVAWILGVIAVMWATNSGFAVYSTVSFSLHMLQHMLLSMIAPVLLVMGTPITLALRALHPAASGRRGPREWISWGINTPFAKFITHPLWVLFIFTVGLYGLYYTSLFAWLMGSHLGHLIMQIHFLLAGYLFAYVVLGLDPAPRVLPPWLRLLLVLVSAGLHSFFALPIMMSDTAFAGDWYAQVQPEWIDSLAEHSRMAGGIAWAVAEIPLIMLIVVLGVQWSRSDEREAKRRDRQADRDGGAELAAYNEHLRKLNESAVRRGDDR